MGRGGFGGEARGEHAREGLRLARGVEEELLHEGVGLRAEGEGVGLREAVVLPFGDPVDLVEEVQGRDASLDRRAAPDLDLEGQEVEEAAEVVGVGRVAPLLFDPDAACEDVPREVAQAPGRFPVALGGDDDVQRAETVGRGPVGALVLGVLVELVQRDDQVAAPPAL